ncbi:MAG TPA: alpha/beta fold hydrolase [Candidatus Saccharimonadia bacterium]|nr:alpha/beta fold hydrolase [Candidatus Saccharimonadia bacterium]
MSDPARWPDYPFESHWFAHADGLRQHYLDEGRGDVVLMLHGNPTWSYYYRHLVLALRATHRCVVPDHVGMGWSDKPDDARYEYSLRQRVADLGVFIDGVVGPDAPITLVVHDWGGMIGLAWAVRNPGRIARLVLLNTAGFPMPADKRLPWLLKLGRDSALGAFLILQLNAFAAGATRLAVTKPLSDAERRAYVAPYDTPANRIATLRFVQDIPIAAADRGHELVRETAVLLPQLGDRPVLICWGLRDFVFDASFLREFERVFPAAEVHAWPDAGHYVLEDARERVVERVRAFLGANPTISA